MWGDTHNDRKEARMENDGYVIAWVSLQTGFEGIGTRPMSKAAGEQWIQSLNQQYDGVLLH